MARMLLMGGLHWQILGCQREENLFEAHTHRSQLQQPPASLDDCTRQLGPHVVAWFAVDLERGARLTIGEPDTNHSGYALQCRPRLRGTFAVQLYEHRFRSPQPAGQVGWRVHRHDLPLLMM